MDRELVGETGKPVFRTPARSLNADELVKVNGGFDIEENDFRKPADIPDDTSGYFR